MRKMDELESTKAEIISKADIIAGVLEKGDCELRKLRDGVSVVSLTKRVVSK